jgi:hypothetical protein
MALGLGLAGCGGGGAEPAAKQEAPVTRVRASEEAVKDDVMKILNAKGGPRNEGARPTGAGR